MAYVPQRPWIQNVTFRDNILFARKYEEKFYNRVVEGCALVSDLKVEKNSYSLKMNTIKLKNQKHIIKSIEKGKLQLINEIFFFTRTFRLEI